MSMASPLPRKWLLLIALVQGLVLLLLHESIVLKFWPQGQPQWLFCFYSMAVVGPLMLLLSLEYGNGRKLLRWVLPYTLLCGLLGYYVGGQATPLAHIRMESLLFAFIFTLAIATFKILLYAQSYGLGETGNYRHLFRFSWRNLFTLGLALLFALAVWGVLMLWAALFKVINIHFFFDLFTERWFYYPVLALAHGFGLIIFRGQAQVIDTAIRIQHALAKFLLIILVLVSLLFLAALPFTGLTPLWETGKGSELLLWLQALILFFTNAVYQDDEQARPYPSAVHRFIYLGVALLPIYSAIAFYGLSLRIEQYGWTIGRCWGLLIALLLALYSLGYLLAIAVRRDHWLASLSKINTRLGWTLVGAMLLVNTPLLDFRKMSVASQLERLEQGLVKLPDFDFDYFRYELARPGYLALQKVKDDIAESHPEIVVRIDNLYRDYHMQSAPIDREALLRAIKLPAGEVIPDSLADALYNWAVGDQWRTQNVQAYQLRRADLNRDAEQDYVLLLARNGYLAGHLFYFSGDSWKTLPMSYTGTAAQRKALAADMATQKFVDLEVIEPQWRLLKLGDAVFQVDSPPEQ